MRTKTEIKERVENLKHRTELIDEMASKLKDFHNMAGIQRSIADMRMAKRILELELKVLKWVLGESEVDLPF